jgi:hypothetical protein
MPTLYGIAGDILDRLEAERQSQYVRGTNVPKYTNTVTLKFKREELLYDIKNMAYVEGDVMPTDNEHDRHQVMDIGEDGNIDRVTRIMDLAIDHCTELLYPYSKKDVDDNEERDDTLTETEEYKIEMKVPTDFSKSTVNYLEKLIHELVVYKVLSDWMSITNLRNTNSAANWAAKIKQLEDDIESTLNARMHRVRRTQTPW